MKEWKKIRSGLKWKNIFVLTLAGCINAFGVTIFLMPVKLYDSGISGTSMLLSQITPSWLSAAGLSDFSQYSVVFIRTEETGTGFFYLCDLCGNHLFTGSLDHHGHTAGFSL